MTDPRADRYCAVIRIELRNVIHVHAQRPKRNSQARSPPVRRFHNQSPSPRHARKGKVQPARGTTIIHATCTAPLSAASAGATRTVTQQTLSEVSDHGAHTHTTLEIA